MPSRPIVAGLLLAVAVLLTHAVPWLTSLTASREPLMGLFAVFPAAYYLFWLACVVTTPREFILLGLCLAAGAVLSVPLSWLCITGGAELVEGWRPSVVGPLAGFAVVTVVNGAIVAAPLVLVEACLIARPSVRFRPTRHLLGGAAVLPFVALAVLLHIGVNALDSRYWLLALPTPLLILMHFLLEAGRAVPHALATLPSERERRAWALLPAVVFAGWILPVALAEHGWTQRQPNREVWNPLPKLGEFADRIDYMRGVARPTPGR